MHAFDTRIMYAIKSLTLAKPVICGVPYKGDLAPQSVNGLVKGK
jgi:hypothetical protein